jgi:hypothetical protein
MSKFYKTNLTLFKGIPKAINDSNIDLLIITYFEQINNCYYKQRLQTSQSSFSTCHEFVILSKVLMKVSEK